LANANTVSVGACVAKPEGAFWPYAGKKAGSGWLFKGCSKDRRHKSLIVIRNILVLLYLAPAVFIPAAQSMPSRQ